MRAGRCSRKSWCYKSTKTFFLVPLARIIHGPSEFVRSRSHTSTTRKRVILVGVTRLRVGLVSVHKQSGLGQIVVGMFGHRHGRLADRQRRLMLPLEPVCPFFVGLAFLFHLSVSLSKSVLILSDGNPPVISGRLPMMGVSPFRREPLSYIQVSQIQEADAAAGFSVFRSHSAIRPSGHFLLAVPSALVRP